ncbi:MAG: L,D-transpeptidase family protein [Magnetococcus sp. DMHC-6]
MLVCSLYAFHLEIRYASSEEPLRLQVTPELSSLNIKKSPPLPLSRGQLQSNNEVWIEEDLYHQVQDGETLSGIARSFDLGFNEIVGYNWNVNTKHPDKEILLRIVRRRIPPKIEQKTGLVINLAETRLYWLQKNGWFDTFPVGIGREGYDTPLGKTLVVRKKSQPTWYVPEMLRKKNPKLPAQIPPGPQNPLGAHALYLGWPGYLIHGTNDPFNSIGRRVSHGCIRLYPEDIAQLFAMVPVNEPVWVINQPAKAGWLHDDLYLELHPSHASNKKKLAVLAQEEIAQALARKSGQSTWFDWQLIDQMETNPDGIPRKVGGIKK